MSAFDTGPNDTPLDPQAYKHQLLLLKSAHCARPVLYQERNHFINGLTLYQNGGRVSMTVYLGGKKDGVDSTEIGISRTDQQGTM